MIEASPEPTTAALASARQVIDGLADQDRNVLRHDLIVDVRIPDLWRVVGEIAFVLGRHLDRLRAPILRIARSTTVESAELLCAQLAAQGTKMQDTVVSVVEQLLLAVPQCAPAHCRYRWCLIEALRAAGHGAAEFYMRRAGSSSSCHDRIRALELALAVAPDHGGAARRLGAEHARLDDYEAAARYYRVANELTCGDADPDICLGLGTAELQRGRIPEALRALSRAIDHLRTSDSPNSRLLCDALCARARARARVGDTEAAFVDAEDAISVAPHSGRGYRVRAEIREQDGILDDALADFEESASSLEAEGGPHSVSRVEERIEDRVRCAPIPPWPGSSWPGSSSNHDDHADSFDPTSLVSRSRKKLSDFIGQRTRDQVAEDVLLPKTFPEMAEALGVRKSSGVALFGPYGCGKTLLAHAIAGELSVPLVTLTPGLIGSLWIYRTENRLTSLPSWIAENLDGKAVVFLDEAEALAPAPEAGAASRLRDQVGLAVLSMVDELLESSPDVVLVLASNRKALINQALLRAGRVDLHLNITSPSPADRVALFRHYARRVDPKQRLDYTAASRKHYSPAEVEVICYRLAKLCLKNSVSAGHLTFASQADLDQLVQETEPRDEWAHHEYDGAFAETERSRKLGFR